MKTLSVFRLAALAVLAFSLSLGATDVAQAKKVGPIGDGVDATRARANITGTATSMVDGAVGAELQTTSWKLTIPAGAFNGAGTVSVTEVEGAEPVVEILMANEALNAFRAPVQLSFKYKDAIEAADKTIFLWDTETLTWVEVAGRSNDSLGWVTVPLWHFSTYRSGKASW